jgi:ABC-type branched-subunit amino acid transport system ATPase component
MAETDVIKIRGIRKSFAGVQALVDVTLGVPERTVYGIIGPNGAGKSTLLNVINGVYEPEAGEILFGATRLNDVKIHHVAKLGISRTFQVARVFRRMSVMENLLAPTIILGEPRALIRERILSLLDFVGLTEKRDQYAYELSGGQQKLLEFARALVTDPTLLLMDEPFAGVHPEIKARLIENIKVLNGRGKSFILVSHDMRSVSELCHRVAVLNYGEKLTEGTPETVLNDERVVEAYLGE